MAKRYNQISREQIGILRMLNAGPNARLIVSGPTGQVKIGRVKGTVVADSRRKKSATMEVPPVTVGWLTRGGFISEHKREADADTKKNFFAITSRGKNYAERDLRKPNLTLAGQKLATPIKDLVLALVNRAGEKGITAKEIAETLLNQYQLQTHYKTVGMTLYRFSTQKLVRRSKDNVWFAVKTKSRAKAKAKVQTPVHVTPVQPPVAPLTEPAAVH